MIINIVYALTITNKSSWMTPITVVNGTTYSGGTPFNGTIPDGCISYTIRESAGVASS